MNIKSNLNYEIVVITQGYIISSNGFYLNEKLDYKNVFSSSVLDNLSDEVHNLKNVYLCEREDDALYIFNVNVRKKEDTVIFDKELLLTLKFNMDYRELYVIEDDNFSRIEGLVDIWLHYKVLLQMIKNKDILMNFFIDILKGESYFKEVFQDKGIGNMNPCNLFYFFARKFNKYVDYLLKNNQENIIPMLFEIGNDDQLSNIDFSINKNVFIIMDCLAKYNISLFTSIKLGKKSFSDFKKLYDVLEKLNIGTKKLWELIADINELSLEQIGSYIIKSIFKNNCITTKLYNYSGEYDVIRNNEIMTEYLSLYVDYLNMMDMETDELFPDNLNEAHDNAIYNKKYREMEKYNSDFIKVVNEKEYQKLIFIPNNNEFKVVAPEKAQDLISEGNEQHNCVGSYINSVIKRICKIYFIRKNNKPYITVEVKGNTIYQVKKAFNKSPDENDFVFIRLWAEEKKLGF